MKIWTQLKAYANRTWVKIKRCFTRPQLDTITGMVTGASIGRALVWAWLGVMFAFANLYLAATIAIAYAMWELWMHYHAFKFLSQYYVMRQTIKAPGMADVRTTSTIPVV